MALPLGKHGNEHIGARHLFPAGRLDVNDRALDHALETGCGLGILTIVHDKAGKLIVDVIDELLAKQVHIDITGPHHGCGVLVVHQREKQMFQRRIFVMALIGERQCAVKALFETA